MECQPLMEPGTVVRNNRYDQLHRARLHVEGKSQQNKGRRRDNVAQYD